ncbi:MAG: electron transport complex subunit RsxC [Elusimicrobiota bacterium]
MRLTFRGGIHPPTFKSLTSDKPIAPAPAPSKVHLLLLQHAGAVLDPLVKPGDRVLMGQKVGDSAERVCAPVHSSVSGKVLEVKPYGHPLGRSVMCVTVENDGLDEPDPSIQPRKDWPSLAPKELLAIVREAGIVGMGGAAFPTHVKLSPPPGKAIDTLIVNGVECEPYLTSDHRLMLERPEGVIAGVRMMMTVLGVPRARVAVEDNKPDAAEALSAAASRAEGVEVALVRTKYPQGSEKQLISALTGRQVPMGGLPLDVGVVVQNAATCFAVHEAVSLGRPLYRRVLTVTGRNIASPANLEVRIGTPFADLLAHCGGLVRPGGKLIMGGPLMGLAVSNDAVPVLKGTSGILALTPEESVLPPERDCLRCGRCVDICPMALAPSLLAGAIERKDLDAAESLSLANCMECGSCTALCPARRPMLQWFRTGKFELAKRKKRRSGGARP